jgi:peptidoglycan pentaglycine glycine transferase (the first glycine)
MKSFLQTIEWLEFQNSLGRRTWRFDDGKIAANIIRHDLPFGMNYLYIPHGPEIDFNSIQGSIDHELQIFVSYVKNIAREQKSIFIKIEPLDGKVPEVLHQFKFKKSKKEIQPRRSVILDLDKPEEELLGAMHHKTRYNIKVAQKHGIVAKPGPSFDTFWSLLQKTAKRDRFASHEKGYYKKLLESFGDQSLKIDLMLAMKDERPLSDARDHALAGAIVLTMDDTAYYMHGASDHEYRALMAPYALHWDLIKYLKEHGVKHYDFWGIDAQKWPGVTRFKLGWGGRQIEYPGAFDLSVRGFWFFVYKIVRKIF